MKTVKSLMAGFEVEYWDVPMPIIATVGALFGLGYVIVLPLLGLISFILLSGYHAERALASIRSNF